MSLEPRRSILVAVRSFAPSIDSKLRVAEDFARALQADVVLLHVVRRSDKEAAARAYLDTLVARLHTAGVHADAVVRDGPVGASILAEAAGSQLVVMGSSRGRGILGVVARGVADRIVRSAACPVVLVQPSADDAVRQELDSFSAAAERSGPLVRCPSRLQTVEVARIVGSVDRASELRADFRPARSARRGGDDQRFERVRNAMECGKHLPAIQLYQLGYGYYVVDGHHRVAAARQLGQLEIEAHVVEFVSTAASDCHELASVRSPVPHLASIS